MKVVAKRVKGNRVVSQSQDGTVVSIEESRSPAERVREILSWQKQTE